MLVPLAARFAETKSNSASDQQVAIRLKEPQSIGDGAVYVRVTAGSSHTNTVAETTLDSYAIPAYRITKGRYAHPCRGKRSLLWDACDRYPGRETLLGRDSDRGDSDARRVADGDIWHIDEWITVRTAGATGTMLASGDATIGASSQATGAVEVTAIDFTAANTIYVKATWSVADPVTSKPSSRCLWRSRINQCPVPTFKRRPHSGPTDGSGYAFRQDMTEYQHDKIPPIHVCNHRSDLIRSFNKSSLLRVPDLWVGPSGKPKQTSFRMDSNKTYACKDVSLRPWWTSASRRTWIRS